MASSLNNNINSTKSSSDIPQKKMIKDSSINFFGDNSESIKLAYESFKNQMNPLDLIGTKTMMDSLYLSGMTNTLNPFIPNCFSNAKLPKSEPVDILSLFGGKSQFQPLDILSQMNNLTKSSTQKPYSDVQLENLLFSLMNNLKDDKTKKVPPGTPKPVKAPPVQSNKELLSNKRKSMFDDFTTMNSNLFKNCLNDMEKITKTPTAIVKSDPEKNDLSLLEKPIKFVSDDNYWTNNLLRPKWKIGFQRKSKKIVSKDEIKKEEAEKNIENELNLVKPKPKHVACSASVSSQASSGCLDKTKEIKTEKVLKEENKTDLTPKQIAPVKKPIFKTIGPFSVKSTSEGTLPEDSKKVEYKRLLNRKAAKKCRQKKKILISKLIEENSILRKKIKDLEEKLNSQSKVVLSKKD